MVEEQRVNRKARVGTVVSDVNEQTIIVLVERASRHRLYKKVFRQTKKYHVHDPENSATIGDIVRIEEGRPVSKKKRWHLLEVLTERAVADVAPEALDEELVDEVQRSAARAAAEEAEAAGEGETGEGDAASAEATDETSVAEASTDEAESDEAEPDESEADESAEAASDDEAGETPEEERAE